MARVNPQTPQHPILRREMLQAGAIGLLGMSMSDLLGWRGAAAQAEPALSIKPPKSVIYLFLTGGPSQHDTFDMKPEAPAEIRGEFKPIATNTPGIDITEGLPMLAQRSQHWSLLRSLSHTNNGHDGGTYIMLTGRSVLPPTFVANKPLPADWPSITAIGGAMTPSRSILPTSVILPEKLYHSNSGVYSGQFAGMLGEKHEPWLIETTDKPHAYHSYSGAFPKYLFDLHKGARSDRENFRFEVPYLSLPEGMLSSRFGQRQNLLSLIEQQRNDLDRVASTTGYDRYRELAISLITDPKVRDAFEVRKAPPEVLERYGDNSFGWSLLMARRLVEAGVNMVQVNLGNFGSWDLHGNNTVNLKEFLFPPTDRAVSALLDDLHESGLLDSTLVVMAGEFGRTPRITHIATSIYKYPGRDHWGPLQSVLFAGGGIPGGTIIGSSDSEGAYPATDRETPESFASTIYQALGIPREAHWHDATDRPYPVYLADPIAGLTVDG
ncbi:MAG: DUF1501 domain-containing protein [Planctomycetaceae bacterium]